MRDEAESREQQIANQLRAAILSLPSRHLPLATGQVLNNWQQLNKPDAPAPKEKKSLWLCVARAMNIFKCLLINRNRQAAKTTTTTTTMSVSMSVSVSI